MIVLASFSGSVKQKLYQTDFFLLDTVFFCFVQQKRETRTKVSFLIKAYITPEVREYTRENVV